VASDILHGWIEPNPERADFAERAWRKRLGLYYCRLRYQEPGKREKRTIEEFRAESPERLIEIARDAQLRFTLAVRTKRLSPEDRGHALDVATFIETSYDEEHLEHAAENTKEKEPNLIANHILPFWGGYKLAEIDMAAGREWLRWLRSPQTLTLYDRAGNEYQRRRDAVSIDMEERLVRRMKAIIAKAIEWEDLKVDRHPLEHLKPRKRPEAQPMEEPLSLVEVELLGWWQDSLRDTALVLALGELVLRQQDAYPMRWSQLLWPGGEPRERFRLREATSGTGSRRSLRRPKSAPMRNVRFFAPVADVFLMLWEEQGRPSPEGDALVLPAATADGMITRKNWAKRKFYPGLDALGIPRVSSRFGRLGPHRLRRVGSSMIGYAGWTDPDALQHLGWQKATTMYDYYVRAYADPDPQMRRKEPEEQIMRARRLALERLPELAERFENEIEEQRRELEEVLSRGAGRREKLRARARLREAESRRARIELMRERITRALEFGEQRRAQADEAA